MQINDALNLVIPLRRAPDGDILVYGYHTPISREIFEANFRALSATKAELFAKGRTYAGEVGPQIAALLLRDEAKRDAIRLGMVDAEGTPNDAGAVALLAELRRLTMVLVPSAAGWEQIPVDVAMARGNIDADDWREAESGLVFFTALYSLCPRIARPKMAEGLAERLGGSMTSLPLMEYAAFLQTLKKDAATATVAAS